MALYPKPAEGSWTEHYPNVGPSGWRYGLDGTCTFVQQESEFFDLDKADYGLVSVPCDVWAGFIFVNLARQPAQSLTEFLGPMITALDGYPFEQMSERYDFRADIN